MFDGVKTRNPFFLDIIQQDNMVNRIVNGIQGNEYRT